MARVEALDLRVVLAQLAPHDWNASRNSLHAAAIVEGHADADLVVFPELFLCGYAPEFAARNRLATEGPELSRIAAAAKAASSAVLVGFAEDLGSGRVANSVACFDEDGNLAVVYRKTHLYGDRERAVFTPGDELCLFHLRDVVVGPLNCFDVEFPEPARALARSGADLLVTVSANMEPYGACHEIAARARAMENQLPHVYVNRVGRQSGASFTGGSMVIDPTGEVTTRAAAGAASEEVFSADVAIRPDLGGDDIYLDRVRTHLRVGHSQRRSSVDECPAVCTVL